MCNVAATVLDADECDWVPSYTFVDASKDRNSCDMSMYRFGARSRGLVFELTQEQFDELTWSPCIYCQRDDKRTGIDRFDNECGYIWDNCVPCCAACNSMKLDVDIHVFFDKAVSIYERHGVSKPSSSASIDMAT
jgi:hypothetical protein